MDGGPRENGCWDKDACDLEKGGAAKGPSARLPFLVFSVCLFPSISVNPVIRSDVLMSAQSFFGELKVFVLRYASRT